MKRAMRAILGLVLAMILAFPSCSLLSRPAYATTWTVDNLGDFWDDCSVAGQCTLRTAIAWASSGDLITFSVSGVITINLSAGYWVNKAVTINGGGAITIDAGNTNDSAFNFVSGANGAVLQNITVRGNAGAGAPLINIVEFGVTLGNVVVQNNAKGVSQNRRTTSSSCPTKRPGPTKLGHTQRERLRRPIHKRLRRNDSEQHCSKQRGSRSADRPIKKYSNTREHHLLEWPGGHLDIRIA